MQIFHMTSLMYHKNFKSMWLNTVYIRRDQTASVTCESNFNFKRLHTGISDDWLFFFIFDENYLYLEIHFEANTKRELNRNIFFCCNYFISKIKNKLWCHYAIFSNIRSDASIILKLKGSLIKNGKNEISCESFQLMKNHF